MNKKDENKNDSFSVRAARISLGDLLLHNPNAYAALCLMFPPDARTIGEIQALTLSSNYMTVLTEHNDIFLISKTPPEIKRYDKKTHVWLTI